MRIPFSAQLNDQRTVLQLIAAHGAGDNGQSLHLQPDSCNICIDAVPIQSFVEHMQPGRTAEWSDSDSQ